MSVDLSSVGAALQNMANAITQGASQIAGEIRSREVPVIPLEKLIALLNDPNQFWKDCCDTFTTEAGQRVITVIMLLGDPLGLPTGRTPYEIGVSAGRKEAFGMLWRRSQRTVTPQDAPKPNG